MEEAWKVKEPLHRVRCPKEKEFQPSGIINRRVESGMSFEGTLNGTVFLSFLKNILIPELKSGDVVICDNAAIK